MAQMQTKLSNDNKNGGNENITGGGNKSNKFPYYIKFYFWTHVAFNHQGGCCSANTEGHKDNTTLDINSTGEIKVFTIVIRKKILAVWDSK